MAEGITLKRIIDMDEAAELTSSDYALVDSATGGPKKFALGDELSSLKEDLQAVETQITATLITDTASGAIASFPDGADDVPVKSLKVDIEPVQSGSGDPSPDNVRPISGHTSAVVTRTGVNVWDEEWELGKFDTTTGENVSSNSQIRCKNHIPVISDMQYYLKTPNTVWVIFYDNSLNVITDDLPDVPGKSGNSRSINGVFKTPKTCKYLKFYDTIEYGTTYNHDISINYPSSDHDYHAYTGNQYTIDLDGTRYGGTLDVGTGVMTVDRSIVDMGTLDWTLDIDNVFICGIIDNITVGARNVNDKSCICEKYAYIGIDYQSALSNNQFIKSITSKTIRIRDTSYSDATAFKASLSNVHMVYQIAEPQTIQLTAQEVRTLLAQNNVFADCGDTTVEYRADTKLYINKVLNA